MSEIVPQLWASTPDVRLCIHCGVGRKGALAIEQVAHNGTYIRLDNKEATPAGGVCRTGGADVLMTTVDVQELIARVKARSPDALIDVRKPSSDLLLLGARAFTHSLTHC